MCVRVRLSEAFRLYPSVGLRRGNAGMSKQFLDGTKVRATLEKVGRERVAECVRGHAARHSGLARPGGEAPPDVARGQPLACLRDEKRGLDRTALDGQQRAAAVEVGLDRAPGVLARGDDSRL